MAQEFWTETRTKLLRAMWSEGKRSGVISRALGCTRNAVIGKACRLHLPLRGLGGSNQRGNTKLSMAKAKRIREQYGKLNGPQLAEQYGVRKETIYGVTRGNTWRAA